MNDCQRRVSNLTITRAQLAEPNMTNIRQRNVGFILIGIGIVLMAVGVYELAQPDMFKSAARIKEPADFHGEFGDVFETTKEILLSDVTLSNVVYRLELREKWDKKSANEDNLPAERGWKYFTKGKIKTAEIVTLLRTRLEVIRVPNTTLVDIVFLSDDAAESALVANTLAEVYRDWRIVTRQRLAQGGIAALQKQLEVQARKIEATKEELDRLRTDLKIPDAEVASENSRTNFPAYWKARKNLEEQSDVWRLIVRKMNIEVADLRLPCEPELIIVELAVPSKTPIRHNRPLGATLTLMGLALFSYGLASVWKSRPPSRHNSPA